MVVAASVPEVGTIVVTAAIDSLNPCAIGVLIMLIGLLVSSKDKKEKLLYFGGIYILAAFSAYLLAGLGLLAFMAYIPLWTTQAISVVVGGFVVVAGIIEIKDYFWYGVGISLAIAPDRAKDIKRMMQQQINAKTIVALGIFVAGVELPCTGGPYLAITVLLSQNFNLVAFALLVLYNIIFVMPLLIILGAVMVGMKVSDIQMWKQQHRATMRLAIGIILVFLGWLLLMIASGALNLG